MTIKDLINWEIKFNTIDKKYEFYIFLKGDWTFYIVFSDRDFINIESTYKKSTTVTIRKIYKTKSDFLNNTYIQIK